MREFDWTPFSDEAPSSRLVSKIRKAFGLERLAAEVLLRRGFSTSKEIHRYLNGVYADLYSPYLFTDMLKATSRLLRAREGGESVFIHGDYDCDGITACAMVKLMCDEVGIKAEAFVPDRSLGYGLSKTAVEKAAEAGHKIIVTCDCGSVESKAHRRAKMNDIDVIVLDHHSYDKAPKVHAFINPHEPSYPFPELCGAGVAFKLIQAMSDHVKVRPEDYLALASLGTVADAVPLVDENRIIVKEGIRRFKEPTNIGLHYLVKVSSLLTRKITAESLGFILAPKINAAGRIDDPKLALDLFLTNDVSKADQLAHKLARVNKKRQAINTEIRDQAVEMIEEKYADDPFIVISDDRWHKGVIGIVASTVVELYGKPCAVISQGYGSVRTIPEFSLLEPLRACSGCFKRWGGHPMAAGLTVKRGRVRAFREQINEVARKMGLPSRPNPRMRYDRKLKLRDVNLSLVADLERLEPFGQGNPVPHFVVENMSVARDRVTNDGQHLQITVRQNNTLTSAVGFWMAGYSDIMQDPSQKFDVLFFVERGRGDYEQMMVKDLKEVEVNW